MTRLFTGLACPALALMLLPAAFGHDRSKNTADRGTTTVTGCLVPTGREGTHYAINGDDGTVYSLKSSSRANLAGHINQRVTVTGYVSPSSKTVSTNSSNAPVGSERLKVTHLSKVSSKCM